MSDDLANWLLERIAEDEDRARWAGPAPIAWLTYRNERGEMGYTTVAAGMEGDDDVEGHWVADGRELPKPHSAQVVYNPARVLAQCEAVRRIVEEHKPDAPYCGWSHSGNDSHRDVDDTACETLRFLALPYAGHPDYREEWRL